MRSSWTNRCEHIWTMSKPSWSVCWTRAKQNTNRTNCWWKKWALRSRRNSRMPPTIFAAIHFSRIAKVADHPKRRNIYVDRKKSANYSHWIWRSGRCGCHATKLNWFKVLKSKSFNMYSRKIECEYGKQLANDAPTNFRLESKVVGAFFEVSIQLFVFVAEHKFHNFTGSIQ